MFIFEGALNPRVTLRWVRVHSNPVDELSGGGILEPLLVGLIQQIGDGG